MNISKKQINKIAVLRALKIGDLLISIPAFKSLRKQFPKAEISLIGLPWAESFVERFSHLIDRFIEFPGYPGLPEREYDSAKILDFIKKMKKQKFDLLLQMHGSGAVVNPLVSLLNAKQTAGFYKRGGFCPDPKTYMPYPETQKELRRLTSLLKFLGIKVSSETLEFPIFETDIKNMEKIYNEFQLEKENYVSIHPGSISARSWSPVKFATVADKLFEHGFKIVLTGTSSEKDVTRAVSSLMYARPIDLTGKTDLGTLAALIKNSHLVISNDTSVSHLADALKVPSVILFTTSNPNIWAPIDENLHKKITNADTIDPQIVLEQIENLRRLLYG